MVLVLSTPSPQVVFSSTVCYRDVWGQRGRNGAAEHGHPTFRLTNQWLSNLFLFVSQTLK